MDDHNVSELHARGQSRRRGRAVAAAAEADLAMRLLIAALILVLGAVVGASTLIQLGEFRRADSAHAAALALTTYARAAEGSGPAPCARLADTDRCVTPAEVAARFVPNRLTR
ncbi:MAG TPA: hypothetical protein VMV26_17720 [Alphaproteobacteria bacterium]|jgi:hypothetical protein|nr:hypothetical protein [Alphaproteobacteria bacterium]